MRIIKKRKVIKLNGRSHTKIKTLRKRYLENERQGIKKEKKGGINNKRERWKDGKAERNEKMKNTKGI